MSPTRVHVVTEFFEGIQSADLERVMTVLHPDIVMIESVELPYGGHYTGLDGFREIMTSIATKLELTIEEWAVHDADPHAISIGRMSFRSPITGESVSTTYIDFWSFAEDGRAVQILPHVLEPGAVDALYRRGLAAQQK